VVVAVVVVVVVILGSSTIVWESRDSFPSLLENVLDRRGGKLVCGEAVIAPLMVFLFSLLEALVVRELCAEVSAKNEVLVIVDHLRQYTFESNDARDERRFDSPFLFIVPYSSGTTNATPRRVLLLKACAGSHT
jgi:hypothetical protein